MELCVVKGYIAENVHETPCCSPRDFRLGSHTSPPWALRCPTNTNSTDQQAPGFYFSPQRLRSVRWGHASIPLRGFDMDEGLADMRLRALPRYPILAVVTFRCLAPTANVKAALGFLSFRGETGGPISVVECLFCFGQHFDKCRNRRSPMESLMH